MRSPLTARAWQLAMPVGQLLCSADTPWEPVRHCPLYCGERSATICVVLGPKKSSTYSSEYASGFSGPAASHLAASPSPRHEGNIGQAPSRLLKKSLFSPAQPMRAKTRPSPSFVLASKESSP